MFFISWNIHKLMSLQGDFPPGMIFDIFNDHGHDLIVFTPFRLKKKLAAGMDFFRIQFSPAKITFLVYNHFEFIRRSKVLK